MIRYSWALSFVLGVIVCLASCSTPTNSSGSNSQTTIAVTATVSSSADTITLTWGAVTGAASYLVYDTIDGSTPSTTNYHDKFQPTTATQTVSNALFGFTYDFAVSSVTSSGTSTSVGNATAVIPNTATSDGLTTGIKQAVPSATLTAIENLSTTPINTGTTPPSLKGLWAVTPFILKASSVSGDSVPNTFDDFDFQLYNQNTANLTIQESDVNGTETDSGQGGYIVGANNKFTIFIPATSIIGGKTAQMVIVISGTLSSSGIVGFTLTNFMVNNNGNSVFIPNSTGRYFYTTSTALPITSLPASTSGITKGGSVRMFGRTATAP